MFDDPIANRVAIGLAKLGMALRTQAWRRGQQSGLTPTQAQVLSLLSARGAPVRLTAVADELGITPPTASDAVSALVAKRLVRKTRAADDRRAVGLALTSAGRRAAEAGAGWHDFLLKAVDALDRAEQGTLLIALAKMIKTLQDRGEIPVARLCVTCRFFRPNAHADREKPHHCAFVDAPFGDPSLRLDCPDHIPADAAQRESTWRAFLDRSSPQRDDMEAST